MEFVKSFLWTFFVILVVIPSVIYATPPSQSELRLYTPSWAGILDVYLDAAGYSDEIDWGLSDYHPYGSHELLSGEWGAAIYYDGISTSPNAMWLSDQFIFPTWTQTRVLMKTQIFIIIQMRIDTKAGMSGIIIARHNREFMTQIFK
jgi:hypothetical protein